ncbi:hypothetical protein AB0K87_11085 [Streptomyces sp. NPDC053705]|uniref:hypothetical protein n=1 Tax=Streptomyces sp. NPDC053705 TaxID=3156668 RepID=UPI00342BE2A2
MTDCTPRELRIIADHVERLTKARVVNQQLGVPTTPDELTVNFPNGYTGTVRWAPRLTSTTPVERQAIARSARHRDAYLLDPGTLQRTREPRATRSPHLSVGTPAANATAALTALQAGARSQAARTTEHGARQHPA